MCRFIAYQGEPVLIADLLYRPRHSLVRQSTSAEQMSQVFNADGFGVGFYTDDQATPCVVRSTVPAWANRGLENLAYRIHSRVVFGHVRAASHGLPVQDTNTHPFSNGRYQFMHNGWIGSFRAIKRALQSSLGDSAWDAIEGTTDSEHAFALVIDELGGRWYATSRSPTARPRSCRDSRPTPPSRRPCSIQPATATECTATTATWCRRRTACTER
jgi:predicted glutamine amidotransferase